MEPALVLLVSADGNSFDWQPNPNVTLPPFTAAAAAIALQAIVTRMLAGAAKTEPTITPGTEGMATVLRQHEKRNGLQT